MRAGSRDDLRRPSDEPTLDEIMRVKRVISDVIRLEGERGHVYTPLLERVLREEEKARRRRELVERAIRISKGEEP